MKLQKFEIGASFIATLLLLCSACGGFQGGSTAGPVVSRGLPSEAATGQVPLGQPAGTPGRVAGALSTPNPYQSNPEAVKQGEELYVKMNCAGCHAYNGKGNMGPDLTDNSWRYGGLPIQIYMSIHDGRPKGMPAWGVALPPNDIWKLVAYVQSLGGSGSVSRYENARQGDRPGEQVAPEAQADAQISSPPAAPILPTVNTIQPAAVPPAANAVKPLQTTPKQGKKSPQEKAGEPPL